MNKFNRALNFIREHIDETSEFYGKIYLVGGCVRDELLGARFTDLDLLINMPDGQKKFVEYMCSTYPRICKGPFYYKRFGTTAMDVYVAGGMVLVECVEPHIEVYNDDGTELLETYFCTLEEDAVRRDFTCNSLYKNVHTGEVLDPSGIGISDLKQKFLRTSGNPDEIFVQDPVRMLRGIRFKHQKEFDLADEAWDAICDNHELIRNSAPNRVGEEMFKIMKCKNMPAAFYELNLCGLMSDLMPNYVPYMDDMLQAEFIEEDLSVWDHTYIALETLTREHPNTDIISKMVVLLADVALLDGIEGAKKVLENTMLGKVKVGLVLVMLEGYLRMQSMFKNGVYINSRPSVLARLVNSLASRKNDFRRIVRALNNGLTPENQLPYQIFYDQAKLPGPNERAAEVVFTEEEKEEYRKKSKLGKQTPAKRHTHRGKGCRKRKRTKKETENTTE